MQNDCPTLHPRMPKLERDATTRPTEAAAWNRYGAAVTAVRPAPLDAASGEAAINRRLGALFADYAAEPLAAEIKALATALVEALEGPASEPAGNLSAPGPAIATEVRRPRQSCRNSS